MDWIYNVIKMKGKKLAFQMVNFIKMAIWGQWYIMGVLFFDCFHFKMLVIILNRDSEMSWLEVEITFWEFSQYVDEIYAHGVYELKAQMRSTRERREESLGQAPMENQGSQNQEKIEKDMKYSLHIVEEIQQYY